MLAVLAGCGGKAKPAKVEAKVGPSRTIQTGTVEVAQRDDDLVMLWKVKSAKSEMTLSGDGKLSGNMTGVTGAYYIKGEIASTFEADESFADQESQELRLKGNVVVISKEQVLEGLGVQEKDAKKVGTVRLYADAMEWDEAKRMLHATGKVKVISDSYEMGPFPVLWVSPDLKEVGTPDQWKEPRL